MNYEGEIREINLVERLIELWRDHFTGAIRFENDGIIKIVYFKGGDILSASTNDRADSVDEILMRAGKVSKEHVKQALTRRKENETLGDALLNLGFITRKELTWARRIQVINVLRSLEAWTAGTFTVVSDYLPKREEGTIFPLPQLLVEMIVTDQDRGRYEKLLESGAAVFTKAPGHEETFRKLGLNEDAEAIMAQVDGERQATEVAAASRQETFNAFKLLHALSILGILERKKPAGPPPSFESAGVADAADMWSGGGSTGAQFQLDDIGSSDSSLSSSDEIAISPVPGLADPSASDSELSSSWDSAPPAMPSTPSYTPQPPEPAPKPEPAWGFDEAQVETARKVTHAQSIPSPVFVPPPVTPSPSRTYGDATQTRRGIGESTTTRRVLTPQKKRAPRYGLLIGAMALFILAALGYYGFLWWQGREEAPAQEVVQPVAAPPVPATTDNTAGEATGTIVPVTESVAPVVTQTVPPRKATVAGEIARAPQVGRAPQVSPAPEGDRARFDAMAREFAANPSGNFTVQFAIVCEPSNVSKALATSSDVWFGPITLKERRCFRMFWGRYATRAEAEAALTRLPGGLRESRPAVVGIPR